MYKNLFYMLLMVCSMPCATWGSPSKNEVVSALGNANAPDSIAVDTLQDVVVLEELLKRRGNEDIVTITKSMREGIRNTGELLGRVAGVFYNPLTTDMQYLGSKNILILVDGVDKGADYIKRLNPERFDKITITNLPSGIYSGYDVVIDLHTRPTFTGHEGVFLTEGVIATGNRNGKGKALRKSRTAGQITYTREKFNIDFVTGYTFERLGTSEYFEKLYPLNGLTETTLETKDREPNKKTYNRQYSADLAVDYDLNEYHSISAKISIEPSSHYEYCNYDIERKFADRDLKVLLNEEAKYKDSGRVDVLAGLWYRGKISRWNLNAYLTYTHRKFERYNDLYKSTGFENLDNRDILSPYISGGVETKCQPGNYKWLFTLSDDFILSDYREKRLETGKMLSESRDFRNTFNGSIQFQGSRKFSMGINAGFSIFRNSFNGTSDTHVSPKVGAQMMWLFSKTMVRLNYALTTQNPPLSSLQDYGQFTDSLIYTAGNPRLKPVLNHELAVSAVFFNSLAIEGRYNHYSNSIFNFYTVAEGMIPSGANSCYTIIDVVNGTRSTWSVNMSYFKMFGKHWQVSLTGKIVGHKGEYMGKSSSKVLPEYSWFVLYNIMNNSLQFYLSGNMMSYSSITPQSKLWCLDDGVALAVSKTFLKQRLQILGMWYLPVHFVNGKWHGGVKSESYSTLYSADNQFRKNNMLQISVLFRFNGGKSVKKYNRSSGTVEL